MAYFILLPNYLLVRGFNVAMLPVVRLLCQTWRAHKLQWLLSLLQQWGFKRTCHHKELKSLIGLLNHACKVVRLGRSFLRRFIDLLYQTEKTTTEKHSIIRLSNACQADIARWIESILGWYGVSILCQPHSLRAIRLACLAIYN